MTIQFANSIVNQVDPFGLQSMTPVPHGLGCTTLITDGLGSGSLETFMAQNSIANYDTAISVLTQSWSNCWCRMYQQYNVTSEASDNYSVVFARMNGLKQDLLAFVTRANSGCNYSNQSNIYFRSKTPSQCQSIPNLDNEINYLPPSSPCTDIFDPRGQANFDAVIPPLDFSRIKSVGIVFGGQQLVKIQSLLPFLNVGVGSSILLMLPYDGYINLQGKAYIYLNPISAGTVIGGDSLGGYSGVTWSTTIADAAYGVSANFGSDFPLPNVLLPSNLTLGISRTYGSCDYSALLARGTPGLPSASFTFGATISLMEIPISALGDLLSSITSTIQAGIQLVEQR